jgi:putative flippase GtrA
LVDDPAWFFDTELLLVAERNGLRIHEVPVDWVDDPDSRVDVVRTARADLAGLWRVARELGAGRKRLTGVAPASSIARRTAPVTARLVGVGGLSTVAFVALFFVLEPVAGALWADVLALGICAVANAAAHRRFTFVSADLPTRRALRRNAAWGALAGAVLSGLAVVAARRATGSTVVELTAAMAAIAVVSVARFAAFRADLCRRVVAAATEPDTTEPDTTEPDTTERDTTEPDWTEPDVPTAPDAPARPVPTGSAGGGPGRRPDARSRRAPAQTSLVVGVDDSRPSRRSSSAAGTG